MWACSFKSLVAFCVHPPAPCHWDLGSCAAKWIGVVLPCSVLNLCFQHRFSRLTLQLQRLFWRCSARNGRKPWLIGKVENWKIRIIGLVFLLVSSVTLGEPLKQMYASTQLSSGQERSLVILEVGWFSRYLGIFCRNVPQKQSVHFWAILGNSAVRLEAKQLKFFWTFTIVESRWGRCRQQIHD